jgi:hypothetical protein
MTMGHQLGLRLFLEGVEVPVIGASVTVAANTPAAASIQVIATDRVLDLLPRTVVHLFFYDFIDAAAPREAAQVTAGVQGTTDALNENYKLLFMGELQGIAFQKDSGSRAVVLNCVDFSNYWDTTYQYNFQGSLLGGRQHAAFIGANANFFTGPLGKGVGTIAALLSGKSVNFPNLKGLLAGIVRILEVIGGAYYGDTTFRGANDFTSIAELRLKVLQQISAAEKDDTTRKLFARKTFNMWMNRQMGSLGKLVTFRGLTRILQQFIFHEIYPNPAPFYQPKVTGLKKKKVYARRLDKDPQTRGFINKVRKLQTVVKSASDNLSKYGSQTTDAGKASILRNLQADLAQSEKIVDSFIGGGTPRGVPGIVREVTTINRALNKTKNALTGRSIFIKFGYTINPQMINSSENRNVARGALGDALAAIAILLGLRIRRSKEVTYDKLDRVHNQILRPDIWFAAPPRCNVLFPELYGNFTWQRNFMREVSRMELQTTHEILGDDALFNGRYYAPNVTDMRKGLRLSSRRFGRLIMAHELMTGIIPMFEKMTEANLFAMRAKKVKYKGAKVGYAQRAVNHQYFKHRFASRGMSVAGRFNPWFVCGFPGVLIDRPMTSADLLTSGKPIADQLVDLDIIPTKTETITKATLLQLLVPTQYFGSCMQLVHNVNQQGGQTSYVFGQARLHREDTEFLGVDKVTVNKKIGSARKKTVVSVIDSSDTTLSTPTPKKNGRGPRGGRITSVLNVTKRYKGRYRNLYNRTGTAQIGFSANNISVKAYEVTEEFTRRARVKIDLPIEEAIRPPWIWDGWSNLKIGQTYMQMFGTNALTDIEGVTSDELLFNLLTTEEELAGLERQEGITQGIQKKESEAVEKFIGSSTNFFDRRTGTGKKKSLGDDRKNTKKKEDYLLVSGTTTKKSTAQKVSASTILTIEKERTIENAVDYLVKLYSFMMHNGLDVGNFIRTYTWRPVMTLPELLGSSDFYVVDLGGGQYETFGTEGFHSRAFGDVEDLFGLVDPQVKKILGLSKEKKHATAKKLDVRKRRRSAVREYVDELTKSRGLLG